MKYDEDETETYSSETENTDDIYEAEDLSDDESITAEESGFMQGYKKAKKDFDEDTEDEEELSE